MLQTTMMLMFFFSEKNANKMHPIVYVEKAVDLHNTIK